MLIVDRFEGDWALLEWDGKTFNFPKSLLPGGAKEGDVLRISLEVDDQGTGDRRRRIRSLEQKLFKQ